MKKRICFLLSPIVLTPAFLISCSKNDENEGEKISIEFQVNDKYFANEENIISAKLNNLKNENYYFDWIFDDKEIVIENNGQKQIKFFSKKETSSKLELIVYDSKLKEKEIARNSTIINIYKIEYSVSINKPQKILSGVDNNLSALFKSTIISRISENLFYKWNADTTDGVLIKNNGKDNVTFNFKYPKNYEISVVVFENNESGRKLCENKIVINVENNQNIRYGLNVVGTDEYTNRKFTNDETNFENVKNEANLFLKNTITQKDLENYLNIFAINYANSFKTQRNNTLTFNILEKNINLNEDKTISGNIKIEFTFNKEFLPSLNASSRNPGDREIHNFVFENSEIEPYVNTTIANFLSFKIKTKYLQKEIITTREYLKNSNVGLKDQYIYLDMIDDLTLQLNNSIFTIIPENFVENTYLYNTLSTTDEKLAFKEIIQQILSSKAKLICGGDHPGKQTKITNAVLEIQLSRNYQIGDIFKQNLNWVLGFLFNFVNTKSVVFQKNNFLYIDCGPVVTYYRNSEKPNSIVDLSNGSEQPYNDTYHELMSLNLYPEEMQIKNKIIDHNKTKVQGSWNDYLKSLSDKDKAKNIYTSFLNIVSYGQKDKFVSSIGGILSGKVLCEGYANLFSYVANIYQLSSITITGHVKENADETGAGGLHAWNLVKVDDKWLWCDPTWDDGMSAGSTQIKYDNFLKTTSEFFTPTTHVDVTNWNNGKALPVRI